MIQTKQFLYKSLFTFGILTFPAFLKAQAIDNQTTVNQTQTIKTQMHYKVNIGRIAVPKTSIDEFKKQFPVTPAFLKTLPGYVNGDYYEMTDELGNLHVTSVVTWESEDYYKNAQIELKKHYEQIHFDRMEFVKRLNVTVENGAYYLVQMN